MVYVLIVDRPVGRVRRQVVVYPDAASLRLDLQSIPLEPEESAQVWTAEELGDECSEIDRNSSVFSELTGRAS